VSDVREDRARKLALDMRTLDPEERERRLARECAGNPELRAEVEAMLGDTIPEHMPDVGSTIGRHLMPDERLEDGTIDPRERLQQNRGEGRPRYLFKGEVGRGGMGAVLKVFDADLRRNLAMKVILGRDKRGPAGNPEIPPHVLERFLEEAQVTGQLEHPGVVPVHELGVDEEGRMYFTMRLVRGKSFDEVIRLSREEREGWNLARALHSLLKICETVAYAHSRRVIHRDLKPSNVMIGRFGETYVMDWGAARLLDREIPHRERSASGTFATIHSDRHDQRIEGKTPSATQEGAIIGTPYYMPPEQATGRLDEIGPHSDVYAVGCMLYQLLAGRRPYEVPGREQTVMEVVRLVTEGSPVPLRSLAPTTPAELVAICEKAMAHRWGDRYTDMSRMAEDLRAYLEGRVVSAHSTGTLARLNKWVARNRALALSLATSAALALSALIGAVVLQGSKLRAVHAQQTLTAQARDQALANEREAQRNAQQAWRRSYVADVIAADASLRANETREGKRLLQDAPYDLRGWEWRHLALEADSSLRTLIGQRAPSACLAVDRDGTCIASASQDGSVRLWDPRDGHVLRVLVEKGEAPLSMSFSADGRSLTTFGSPSDATVRRWSVETGEMISALPLPERPASPVVLDADGTRLAFAGAGNVILVVDARTAQVLRSLEGHEGAVRAQVFVSDQRLLSASDDGTVRLWDVARGHLLHDYPGEDGAVMCLAVHPRLPVFVTGAENGVVRRRSLDGDESEVLVRHAAVVHDVAFGPGARLLASVSRDKTVQLLDLASGQRTTLQGHDRPVHCVAFDPGGRFLVTGGDDPELRIWPTDRAAAITTLEGPENHVAALAVDPAHERIALGAHFGGTIQVYSSDARLLETLEGQGDPVNDLAFSTDGTALTAAMEEEATVRVLGGTPLTLLQTLHGHEASVTSVAFRPGSAEELASGSTDFTVKLWDRRAGQARAELVGPDQAVLDVAFQPGGALLAAAFEDGSVSVWEVEGGARVHELQGSAAAAQALAWSPDGRHLAVGCGDNRLRVWDLEQDAARPRVPLELEGHDQRISTVAFRPDGSRIVTGSYDGSLRIWATDPPEPLLSLRRHTMPVTSVAFSADGADLFSASFDNTVRIWRTRP